MKFRTIHVLLFTSVILVTSCSANINSHSSKLTYRSPAKDVLNSGICFQDAICQPVQNATCFGTPLPYSFTSLSLADDSVSHFEVQDNLALWQGLRSVPRCWAVVQPLLCAVYMPKCENNTVFLPSQEMCRITRGPCKVVEARHSWPPFLQCENKKLFPPRCRNPLQEIKFNTSSKCIAPLVETDITENWFSEVEGCGIQCQDPFYTDKEHESTHRLIAILATFSFISTLFAVLTFFISWKVANTYPGIIIFYINMCLALASFGWLIQFFPGAREEIVCLHDGTIRRQQPRSGEHLCSITFVLIYSFLMAAIVWFVILTYSWSIVFRETSVAKDTVKKKASYFHLCAWCIPLVLTTTNMAIKEVDGDSMSGICFVGYVNSNMRIIFLLAPICVAVLIAGFFLCSVLYTLIKVKFNSDEVTNEQAKKKLRRVIFKIGIFSFVALIFFICTFGCHAYDIINKKYWMESLREYIVCLAMNSEVPITKCFVKHKPSVSILHLHLCCVFGFAIAMSAWVWTKASVEAWKRFFYGLCAPSEKNASTLKKHELIAKAFQRRHQINQGHLSLSLNSNHDDPIGMNFDMNSVASRDISSSWAMALPQFLMRRNAVAGITPFSPRQYSSASDISHQMSVDSFNQPNLDSLSMQISEQEYVAHALRHQRRKTRKERERFLKANRIAPWFPGNRRGSDTSLQSSLMAASIVAAAAKNRGVTKSTSTGDLGAQAASIVAAVTTATIPPVVFPPPMNRTNIQSVQRPAIKPPFTHGMTDNSHRLDCRNTPPSSAASTTNLRFTPNPMQPTFPMGGMIRPPMYGQGYDLMNTVPYGFMGGSMYPSMNGLYPGYPCPNDFSYPPYNIIPYGNFGSYQTNDALYNQYQQNLIPLHPRVDSASETEYLPIIMSDSEFTDAGHRSYDEAQRLAAHRIIQECVNTQILTQSHVELPQPKPGLEPQECAKTQFLKRMVSFNAKPANEVTQASRPPSGRKSPHSEVPPPSPADSAQSLAIGDDDVFEDPQEESIEKSISSLSLPQTLETEGVFQKLKSKFRRSISVTKAYPQPPEEMELAPKPCFNSLRNLAEINLSPIPKTVFKEKSLNAAEMVNLINGKEGNENVSR